MNLYKFQEKLNRENIINRQTIEYLYLKNRCCKRMVDDYDLITKIAGEVFDQEQFEIQLQINIVPKYNESRYSRRNEQILEDNSHNIVRWVEDTMRKRFNLEFNLSLVIKFNDITITNSEENSINAKDIYVVLQFDHTRDGLSLTSMKGTRTTFSVADVLSEYAHSHLPSISLSSYGKRGHSPQYFCVGSDEVHMLLMKLGAKDKFTPELFKLMLLQLEPYLSWESLEGKPYKYMKNVFEKGEAVSSIDIKYENIVENMDLIFSNMLTNDSIKYFFNIAKGKYFVMPNKEYRDFISNMLPNFTFYWSEEDQKFYSRSIAEFNGDNYVRSNWFKIPFKGKALKVAITDERRKNDKILMVHPDVEKFVTKIINVKINLKLLKYYGSTIKKAKATSG